MQEVELDAHLQGFEDAKHCMETGDNRGGIEHPTVMQDKHKPSIISDVGG